MDSIALLVRDFETCTLPRPAWNHAAHLTVGLWYLSQYPQEQAVVLIREGIQRYNAAWGVGQTRDSGYHETLTCFYIWLIDQFLNQQPDDRPLAELAEDLIARYGDRKLALEYWSPDRLFSWEARTGWVEPDLRCLGWQPAAISVQPT